MNRRPAQRYLAGLLLLGFCLCGNAVEPLTADDASLRNLMITVKNNNITAGSESNSEWSGGIRRGTVYVGTGKPPAPPQEGANLRYKGLAYSTSTTSSTSRSAAEYQLRTLENHPAYITTGESRQFSSRRYGSSESTRVDAEQGFYVQARLAGNRVVLDIFVVHDEFGQPVSDLADTTITTQRLSTSVSGQVGEWIALGGLVLREDADGSDVAKKITTHSQSLGDISIRVNPLP